jgi:DNA-binding beta-propeller fold protein YncE
VTSGFSFPIGILYDGANMWVTDQGTSPGKLFKLDSNGAIILTIDMGTAPSFPAFDGTNIWVPNTNSSTITVVRASTGAVLATLGSNGLNHPETAAFDGERILVTNFAGNSVSLWKATDLSPLGSVSTGSATNPLGACSDGLNFWITLDNTAKLARF